LWPLSPLFYQDAQIFIFPAPLSRLGVRLIGWRMVYAISALPYVFHARMSVPTTHWVKQEPG
jgi:hypothetical protein